jgi:two-component system chemotaxis response regulator CheB
MKVIVIGGSAGSIDVLMQVIPNLPVATSYALVICLHRKAQDGNQLEALLSMKTAKRVVPIEDKTRLLPNIIYVVPSDYHVLFETDGTVSLDGSEKVHYSRPSIDVVFHSLARVYTNKAVGILLSGANEDGASGLESVHKKGGFTVVQSPDSADFPAMPASALKLFEPDLTLTPKGILRFLETML